jgi:pimeloyl-ACP methyl ester carboxylesterase
MPLSNITSINLSLQSQGAAFVARMINQFNNRSINPISEDGTLYIGGAYENLSTVGQENKRLDTNGAVVDSSGGQLSELIEVDEGDILIYTGEGPGTTNSQVYMVGGYSSVELANPTPLLQAFQGNRDDEQTYSYFQNWAIIIPPGVTHIYAWSRGASTSVTGRVLSLSRGVEIPVDDTVEINLDSREIVDGGSVNFSNGTIFTGSSLLGVTSFLNCNGAKTVTMMVPVLTTSPTNGIAFYDSEKTYISGVARPQGGVNGAEERTYEVPENAVYFRSSYWNFVNQVTYGQWYCRMSLPENTLGYNKFRPFQDGRINFTVRVNQSVPNYLSTADEIEDSESFLGSTGVLVLPDNYTPTGSPVKAIMFCHGLSRNVSLTQWGLNNETWLAQKEFFRENGFIVFDVNGQNSNGGSAIASNGCPQAVTAYRRAFEYISEHYNVDPEILIIGSSAGGAVGLNYTLQYPHVRAFAGLAPWTDILNCAWGQGVRQTFVDYFGFDNTTTYEADKTQGYDPGTRIVEIDGTPYWLGGLPCPVRIWMGSEETSAPLQAQVIATVDAMQNSGVNAILRIIDGAGHEVSNGGSVVADTECIYWLKRM